MTDKPGFGPMGMGPLSGMLESMDMVRRAWSSLNLPSNFAPTLDIDELDRRIKDLKAVEQWLSMNLGMLQGTIQGMEVQRGTLAALQAFGQSMSQPAGDGGFAAQAMAAMRGAQAATGAAPKPAHGASAAAPEPAAAPVAEDPPVEPSAPPGAESPGIGGLADEISRAAAAVNPAAWWNLLQSQFEQIAQTALRGGPDAPAGHEAEPRKAPRPGGGRRGNGAAPAGKSPGKKAAGAGAEKPARR